MKNFSVPALWLRIRLRLARLNPVLAGTAVLTVAALASLAWLASARLAQEEALEAAKAAAAIPAPPAPARLAPPPTADQNLAHFYGALGERSGVERQLKAVFALAEKNGLVLRQGEYRSTYDRTAQLYTYQLNLPVTGRYGAIWQFAFDTLRAVPHASLDDVAFRREAIGEEKVDARLRMTLYLSAASGTGAPR